jgi:hypothetical protein
MTWPLAWQVFVGSVCGVVAGMALGYAIAMTVARYSQWRE